MAQTPASSPWSASAWAGNASGYRLTALALQRTVEPPVDLSFGNWRATHHLSVEAGQWQNKGTGPDTQHLGGTWRVRWSPASGGIRPYLEAAFGGAWFNRSHVGPRDIGGRGQFTEQVGAGVTLGTGLQLGWRYVHYSNAGLHRANDGVDMHALVLTWSP